MNINLIASAYAKSPIAEAYRMLRTNVQFSNTGKELKSIMITSCMPAEGKSTTIANLAYTMSQAGSRVLVMDCDFRRSVQHKIFNVPNEQGMSGCISMGLDLVDIIQKTEYAGLFVAPSGVAPPNPSELLMSERFKYMLESAKKEFDYVLIDAPPVMPVTDASVLANYTDGILLLMSVNIVAPKTAMRVKKQLESAGGHILGVVLNKMGANEQYGYGYGYGYSYNGYSYYYGDEGK